MKFVGVIERSETMTVDGYSNAKSINGAIAEFGKYIMKYFSESEGSALVEYKSDCLLTPQKDCEYFLTIEEVGTASNWNEETETMEYSDGKYYLCIRFYK